MIWDYISARLEEDAKMIWNSMGARIMYGAIMSPPVTLLLHPLFKYSNNGS
jgi:hypothetical protein